MTRFLTIIVISALCLVGFNNFKNSIISDKQVSFQPEHTTLEIKPRTNTPKLNTNFESNIVSLTIPKSQNKVFDKNDPVEIPIITEKDDENIVHLGNFEPPNSFMQTFGENAKNIWNSFMKDPEEILQKKSTTLPITNSGESGINSNSNHGTTGIFNSNISDSSSSKYSNAKTSQGSTDADPNQKDESAHRRAGPKYVTWKMKDTCEGSEITGFITKTFNEKNELLKQNFVPIKTDDIYGCQEYRFLLEKFLPDDGKEFKGWLSVAGIDSTKKDVETVWQNLVKPKEFSIDEYGPGTVKLSWDPPLEDKNVKGYKFYFGRKSGKYTHVVDMGKSRSIKISGLVLGTWYFACTHYDINEAESDYANEVSLEVKDSRPLMKEISK